MLPQKASQFLHALAIEMKIFIYLFCVLLAFPFFILWELFVAICRVFMNDVENKKKVEDEANKFERIFSEIGKIVEKIDFC